MGGEPLKYFGHQLAKLDVLEEGVGLDICIFQITGNGLLHTTLDSEYYREVKKRLKKDMAEVYNGNLVLREFLQQKGKGGLRVGEICIFIIRTNRYLDEACHRVKVLKVEDVEEGDADMVEVEGIDAFFQSKVPYHKLYHMTEEFMRVHPLRLTCQLKGMEVFEGTRVVELVMGREPINLPFYAFGTICGIREYADGSGLEGQIPIMNVEKFQGEELFRLEYYVLEKLETLLDIDIGSFVEDVDDDPPPEGIQEDGWIRRRGYLWLKDIIRRALRRARRQRQGVVASHSCLRLSEDSLEYSLKNVYCASVPKGNKFAVVRAIILDKENIRQGVMEMDRKLIIRQIDEGVKCEVKAKDVFPLCGVDKALCCIPPLSYPRPLSSPSDSD